MRAGETPMAERRAADQRVLLLPPTARDGQATHDLLATAGLHCAVCATMDRLCAEVIVGAAVVIVPEEAVLADEAGVLSGCLRRQPVWSDLPVIVLSQGGAESPAVERATATLGNVSLIERPMRISTLMSMIRSALGARERQYQVREHLEERLRAEERLREIAARLRAIFDQSTAGIAQLDVNGRYVLVNQWLCDLLGYRREELLQLRMQDVTHPEDLPHNLEVLERSKRDGGTFVLEKRYVRKDGSHVWVNISMTTVRDADGIPQSVLGIVTDLTERKRSEERLARDAMLLSKVQDSVIVTDAQGIVTFWNEGATRLLGWTAEEMIGRPMVDRLPEESREQTRLWIARIAAGEAEFEGEWLDQKKDGTPVWIEASTRRICDATGNVLGIMGVSRDISERKRTEEALARSAAERAALLEAERFARAEAERAGRMKDEFLATLSHELRTPLNAILGWSQILAGGSSNDEDLQEGLRTIERNARAQTQIIEDLLDMSRIISGKVRLDVQRIDLALIVSGAIETVRPAAQAKGVQLQAVLGARDCVVSGDPNRLQQVMWNLLTNAVKFTPRDGRVQVRLACRSGAAEVSVIDSGEGIKPEFLPHVFDRFRQADPSTTRRHGGLGLGLAIVKQLVELHGGTVSVESAGIGSGATFTVILPLAVNGPHAPFEPEPTPTIRSSDNLVPMTLASSIAGLNVLVVDDEPDARALVRRVLEDCNAVVRTAASVSEAIDLLARCPSDVLVSDIGMPVEDGYDLIRRVRALGAERGGNIPAVALTAYARSEDRMRTVRAGFQMHIAKPVAPAELIEMVASLARRTN